MSNKIILLCGPTASGKTDLSLKLTDFFPIEIVSIDSALIYKDLTIGAAKPSEVELRKVPHHLIDIISPLDNYSVKQFLTDCEKAIKQIQQRGNIPVLVGGTMMYYNALMNGLSDLPAADSGLRQQLEEDILKFGNVIMHKRLNELDSVTANKISPNDTQRLQRALEVCLLTGKPMSVAQQEHKISPLIEKFDACLLALVPEDRKYLHDRINFRFNKMLELGFIDEVKQLKLKYPELTKDHNSMRCVGYRQVWNYLDGLINYNELQEHGQAASRQLAKRQITWLRSFELFDKINSSEYDEVFLIRHVKQKIEDFL